MFVAFRFQRKLKPSPELWRELTAYATALTQNRDLADDLMQDTLLKIYEKGIPVRNDVKTKHYLFRMLRNLHIDNLRKSKVRMEYAAEQARLFSVSATAEFDTVEQLIVRDAFSLLSPEHREILFLVDVMGFRYADAAETLGVAMGTVMSRVSRARSQMIDNLEASPVRPLERGRKKRM